MHPNHQLPPAQTRRMLWLDITMSARLDDDDIAEWRNMFQAYLRRRRLAPLFAGSRVLILGIGREISAFDRGMVIGWLLGRQDCVFVKVGAGCRLQGSAPEVSVRQQA